MELPAAPVVSEVPLKVGQYQLSPHGKIGRAWQCKGKKRYCNSTNGLTLKLQPDGIIKVTKTKPKVVPAQPSCKWITYQVLNSTPPIEDLRDRRRRLLLELQTEVPSMEAGQRLGAVLDSLYERRLCEQVRSMKLERGHWKQFSLEDSNGFLSFYMLFPRFYLFTLPFGKECDELRLSILEDWVAPDYFVAPLLQQASVHARICADTLLTFGKICMRLNMKEKALSFYAQAWETARASNLYLQMLDVANSYSRTLLSTNQKDIAKGIIEAVGFALFNLLQQESEPTLAHLLSNDPWRRTAAKLRGKLCGPAKETGAYLLSCE